MPSSACSHNAPSSHHACSRKPGCKQSCRWPWRKSGDSPRRNGKKSTKDLEKQVATLVFCFPFKNTLILPRLSRTFAFFGQKRDLLSGIVSCAPLFSYTSPEVPSFLTSLWVCATFLTLISLSRLNGHRFESCILCISIALSSFGVAWTCSIGPRRFGPASGRSP
jgi:hypothetical protein